jgi:hypothetical protein
VNIGINKCEKPIAEGLFVWNHDLPSLWMQYSAKSQL